MRKTTKLFLGFTAGLLLLCGCSAAEEKLGYENADVAKEALASASSVRMRCDLDNVDASGNIYADEKAAAYMKNSGLFDQTWTISISGEEWFHMKIVTDEEINKMTKSATTYAFYDPDNNLLGYAQERVTTPDSDAWKRITYFFTCRSERKTILRIRGWTYHLYRGRNGDRFCEKRDGLVRFTVQSLCEPGG